MFAFKACSTVPRCSLEPSETRGPFKLAEWNSRSVQTRRTGRQLLPVQSFCIHGKLSSVVVVVIHVAWSRVHYYIRLKLYFHVCTYLLNTLSAFRRFIKLLHKSKSCTSTCIRSSECMCTLALISVHQIILVKCFNFSYHCICPFHHNAHTSTDRHASNSPHH